MKFSDLMLDLATGDASPYDAYIEEAIGRINVSAAMFDANTKIMEAAEQNLSSELIQEAAEDCGLPTTYQEAKVVCCQACKEITATIPALCKAIAKKLKTQCTSRTKGFGAIVKGIGNKVVGSNKHIMSVKEADAFLDSYTDTMKAIETAFNSSTSLKGLTKGLVKATKMTKVVPVGSGEAAFNNKTAQKMGQILNAICEEAGKVDTMFGDLGHVNEICDGSSDADQAALMEAGKGLAEALKGLQASITSQFGDTLAAVGGALSEK